MDEPSSSSSISSSVLLSRSPAIDRHNPIITDSSRRSVPSPAHPPPRAAATKPPPPPPPSSQKKNRMNTEKLIPPKENGDRAERNVGKPDDEEKVIKICATAAKSAWGCAGPSGDLISPPGSTRYLLHENVSYESLPDSGQARTIFPSEKQKDEAVKVIAASDNSKPPSSTAQSTDKVIALRVSLHCRGCERKMRKHLSRMQGVTSFNLDFAAKKVTVTGNVTPSEVLLSISKVKNAEFWSPTQSLSPPSSSPLNLMSNSQFNYEYKGDGTWVEKVGEDSMIKSDCKKEKEDGH